MILPVGELVDRQPPSNVHVAALASDLLPSAPEISNLKATPCRGLAIALSPSSIKVYQRRAQSEALQWPRQRQDDRVMTPKLHTFEPFRAGAKKTTPIRGKLGSGKPIRGEPALGEPISGAPLTPELTPDVIFASRPGPAVPLPPACRSGAPHLQLQRRPDPRHQAQILHASAPAPGTVLLGSWRR